MNNNNYFINDNEEFVIEDYNHKKAFSSFLPAGAGLYGKPMWAYYVNRGQCISTFGMNNKDYSIMEFLPANKAYRQTSLQGFRTFLKIKDNTNNKTTYYEPFQDNYNNKIYETQQRLYITSYDLKLEEINKTLGFKIEVMFCTLPGEKFAGLIRKVEITNISDRELEIEVLDGMPIVIPYYLINNDMKNESNLRQAWMSVDNYNTLPFYRIKALPYDTPETVLMEGGNFFLNFDFKEGKINFSKTLIEPNLVFGEVTDLSYPQRFIEDDFKVPEKQVDLGITPCGLGYKKLSIEVGKTDTTYTLIGSAEKFEKLSEFVAKKLTEEYMVNKINENKALIESSKNHIMTSSSSKEFDLYCGQTFMDNFLRGGYPIKVGNGKHNFYVYSRKHGDLEREYNFFQIDATNYSQGNSNFRDVNQNRRNDVYFFPFIEDTNIKTFFNLLQLDGFNPLVLKGSRFALENKAEARNLIVEYFNEKDSCILLNFVKKAFTPGSLLGFLEQNEMTLKKDNIDVFFNKLIALSTKEDLADFQEGYWVDHWTYNNDLLEQFMEIFPDKVIDLMFNKKDYTYYDNFEVVVPRIQRHILTKDGVRQSGSLVKIAEKEKMIKERISNPNQLRTDFGKGEIYHSTLISKIVCLIVNKIASIDPSGVGVEMEGNKPGWCDALNGLPAILGSSINESTEIKRLSLMILELLKTYKVNTKTNIQVPKELYTFFSKVRDLLVTQVKDFMFWDLSNTAKEEYRKETTFGISGKEEDINLEELILFLEAVVIKVERGLEKALNEESGVYYTYFINAAKEYEITTDKEGNELKNKNGLPLVRVTKFEQRPIPYFLEGPVHVLRMEKDTEKARQLFNSIKKTGLYDQKLDMYMVNANIMEETKEIGRQNVFPRGWLENEAVFLHMEYKYFLELLRVGLYDEFFNSFKNAFIPFLDPKVYGRSILENSSFIASSVHTDEKIHGNGFVSRLTGASAEFLNIWRYMTVGQKPFFLNENNELNMEFKPVIPSWLFAEEAKELTTFRDMKEEKIQLGESSFAFNLLGSTLTTYHNKTKKDTFGVDGAKIDSIEIFKEGKLLTSLKGNIVTAPFAEQVRAGNVDKIEIYFK
ncbi:MAG: hypothetical protein H7Y18_02520 [Clostridiaceae bacterium]|nr:hypothetical protein [Clostridiaceae bacterium]